MRDTTISTLANQVGAKLGALKGLAARLSDVDGYLQNVLSGRLPVNHKVIYALQVGARGVLPSRCRVAGPRLCRVASVHTPCLRPSQDVFNLLPNLNVEELVKAFAVKTNDMMLAIYLASVIRSIVALHNLIDNRIVNKEKERASDEAAAKKDDKKEGEEDKDKAADKGEKENPKANAKK